MWVGGVEWSVGWSVSEVDGWATNFGWLSTVVQGGFFLPGFTYERRLFRLDAPVAALRDREDALEVVVVEVVVVVVEEEDPEPLELEEEPLERQIAGFGRRNGWLSSCGIVARVRGSRRRQQANTLSSTWLVLRWNLMKGVPSVMNLLIIISFCASGLPCSGVFPYTN
jgi:hypothetical protein